MSKKKKLNLQNLPIRTPDGTAIRQTMFKGGFVTPDYTEIEKKLAAQDPKQFEIEFLCRPSYIEPQPSPLELHHQRELRAIRYPGKVPPLG